MKNDSVVQQQAPVRQRDMHAAQSPEDIMELRKQETRRRVTYTVVGAFCLVCLYLVWFGAENLQMTALTGLLGLAGPIIGFYFGSKQTGQ